MSRFCTMVSWACNSLAVGLLVVGILVAPDQARADGEKTCDQACAGSGDYSACMAMCLALTTHPCGGTDTSMPTCAVAGSQCLVSRDPFCSGKFGCYGWTEAECPCTCWGTMMGPCGCY
jgi:hypothetical protein